MSGVIHWQLSIKSITDLRNFRADLATVCLGRIHWIIAVPSEDAHRYKQATIDSFLFRKTDQVRAKALMAVFTGDWRNTSHVEILIPLRLSATRDEANIEKWKARKQTQIVTVGVWALAGRYLTSTYNRSKWDGLVDSLCGPGLLQQVHGLGRFAYQRWLQRFVKPAAKHGGRI